MLTDLVRLRDTVYEQLDRTHKPRQQTELYLLAGQFWGLLSSVSLGLGRMDMAQAQAQAAHTYGSVIDHQSLRAWVRTLQSNVYLWCDRPRQAISVAESALSDAPRGTARARLHAAQGRAVAILGGYDEATTALDSSSHELDVCGNDPLMGEIGGEFGFDRARHALCIGAAYVLLGNAPLAEARATRALELFDARPPHERWKCWRLGSKGGSWRSTHARRRPRRGRRGTRSSVHPGTQVAH
jgi:tetratricopeptide (TPR) repeat protein